MSVADFVDSLGEIRLPSVFNPYTDRCSRFDLPDAPAIRRKDLESHLQAALDSKVETIWFGRDLGYRGGRRTGIAFTDEPNLRTLDVVFGQNLSLSRATRGPVVSENTAGIVWNLFQQLEAPAFTWNVFPFHPHKKEDQSTNRCHTRSERFECQPILVSLLNLLQPTKIVAIGNDAADGLADLDIPCLKVRHPSYGGKADFVRGILSSHAHKPVSASGDQASLF